MARERSHTDIYPFIPDDYLVRRHNRLIRKEPLEYAGQLCHAWRPVHLSTPFDIHVDRSVLIVRIQHMEIKHNMKLRKLAEPFPCAPQSPGKYELTFKRRDGKFAIHIFAAKYSAQKFINATIKSRPFKWIDSNRIRVHDLAIISPHLEDIMDHELSDEESAWILPTPHAYHAEALATNASWAGAEDKSSSRSSQHTRKRSTRQTGAPVRSSERFESTDTSASAKTPRVRSSKVQSEVEFTIIELSEALDHSPKQVRSALRKSNTPKPVQGWQWPRTDFERIKGIVQKNLK